MGGAVAQEMGAEADLVKIVLSHSQFFDRLVDLIPANVYLPLSDDIERPWGFGMNKKQKQDARKKTKERLKKARKDRLDPEKIATTSQLLQQRNQEVQQDDAVAPAAEEKHEEEEEKNEPKQAEVDRAKSSEELRERLHKRIEAIRAQRLVNKARDWQKKTKDASKKRKKSEKSEKTEEPVANKRLKPNVPQAGEMEFGRVKIESQKRIPNRKSKDKLLEQATKLQKDLQDSEKGKEIAAKHSWDAALNRASGERVLDNPKLLKQSLKRDQQRREKSAHKWQDRHETEVQKAQEKQQTRAAHIKERIDARKARAIAKREKKLMRPGFEGRKSGFLNEVKDK